MEVIRNGGMPHSYVIHNVTLSTMWGIGLMQHLGQCLEHRQDTFKYIEIGDSRENGHAFGIHIKFPAKTDSQTGPTFRIMDANQSEAEFAPKFPGDGSAQIEFLSWLQSTVNFYSAHFYRGGIGFIRVVTLRAREVPRQPKRIRLSPSRRDTTPRLQRSGMFRAEQRPCRRIPSLP